MISGLVSVIIVTHNNEGCLRSCLESLNRQIYTQKEVIVVLNNCTDSSKQLVASKFPDTQVIINRENLSFAKAQNQGIELAKGEFILSLNDDCLLDKNFIFQALKAFSLDAKIGMVSGKILRSDGITIDTTGLFLGKSRKPIERGYNQKDTGQFQKRGYIYGVPGAVGFYRRKMLEETKDNHGYFDIRFNMFYEDLDLCWRANRRGWKGYYIPGAVAYHKRGGSAKLDKPTPRFLKMFYFTYLPFSLQCGLLKSRYMTIIKNDSLLGVFQNLPFILAYEFKIWVYLLIIRGPQLFKRFLHSFRLFQKISISKKTLTRVKSLL